MADFESEQIASVIFAAGKGSRMAGYEGNKTLLPLVPGPSSYEGRHPLLLEVLHNLPAGPKGIVVNHCAADVERATAGLVQSYLPQPVTNGTGGALLAARPFLEEVSQDRVIITMGDVPLIRPETYAQLADQLAANDLAVLAFDPADRLQYGMLEMEGERVVRIVEWKYWNEYSAAQRRRLRYCNGGVYAAKRGVLLDYLTLLAAHPHRVQKQRAGQWLTIEEYFLTDIVELMAADGLPIGLLVTSEQEVTGVDTPEALQQVQQHYLQVQPTSRD